MPLQQLKTYAKKTPFHDFICDGCGKKMAEHWCFRAEKMADVTGGVGARKPDGKFYCSSSGTSYSGSHYQRELRDTLGAR